MPNDIPEDDRVAELIRQSERAMSTADLKKAYREKYGPVDAAFRRGIRWLPYDGVMSKKMQDVIIEYDIGTIPPRWNPNMNIFFISEEQVYGWAQFVKNSATRQ